jgi:hypothetical protein
MLCLCMCVCVTRAGATLADFVMPFFLFMVGTSMAMSFKRYQTGLLRKVLTRTVCLTSLQLLADADAIVLAVVTGQAVSAWACHSRRRTLPDRQFPRLGFQDDPHTCWLHGISHSRGTDLTHLSCTGNPAAHCMGLLCCVHVCHVPTQADRPQVCQQPRLVFAIAHVLESQVAVEDSGESSALHSLLASLVCGPCIPACVHRRHANSART